MLKPSSPTVSVVMPTYNRADLLPDVIASILSQDYQDLELLIVDDGSTDDTQQVIRALQEKDERVRYYKLGENKGLGFARQAGLERATGKYIAIADHDDIWLAGKIKLQIEELDAHPEIDILFGDFWNISHIRNTETSGFEHTRAGMQYLKVRHVQDDLWIIKSGVEAGILVANFISPPTMIIRASLFEKIGGFDPHLMAVDDEFAFRAAVLGAKFAYIEHVLTHRHVYPSGVSQQKIKSQMGYLKSLSVCRQVCESSHREDLVEHVDRAIRRTSINLMFEYGQAGKPGQVWGSFQKAVSYGFSLHDFTLFLISLGGPKVIDLFERFRRVKQTWLKRK